MPGPSPASGEVRLLLYTKLPQPSGSGFFGVLFSFQKTGCVCSPDKPVRMSLALFCNNTRWSPFFSLPRLWQAARQPAWAQQFLRTRAGALALPASQGCHSPPTGKSALWGRVECIFPSEQLRSLRGLLVSFILLTLGKRGIKSFQTGSSPPFP